MLHPGIHGGLEELLTLVAEVGPRRIAEHYGLIPGTWSRSFLTLVPAGSGLWLLAALN